MFFTRRDGAVKAQMKRRLRSSRASVFLEYAIVLPIVVMLISALFEFSSLWDAKIMANHAAWTVGRIATVRPKMTFSEKLSDRLESFGTDQEMSAYMKALLAPLASVMKGANKLNNCGNVATLFLMSTCSCGFWGESISGDVRSMLMKMITGPIDVLKKNLVDWMTEAIKKSLGKLLPESIKGTVIELVVGILKDLIEKIVFKPLSSLIGKIIGVLFPSGLFDWIQQALEKNRTVRGILYAATRVTKCDVLTLQKFEEPPFAFTGNAGGWGNPYKTSFPRVLDKNMKIRDRINQVSMDSGWPPNSQFQPMYRVKVAWPYERTWLFPIVSGYEDVPDESGMSKPTAVGWSLVYSQPDICNDNLLAEGAQPFSDGTKTNQFADILKELKADIEGHMKVVAFGMRYRLKQEKFGPHDADENVWYEGRASRSHKAIGLQGQEKTRDGLVYWCGRAPSNLSMQGKDDYDRFDAWQDRKKAVPSYIKSWKVLTCGAGEADRFRGAFGKKTLLERLENLDRGHNNLWWYWTPNSQSSIADNEFQRRYYSTSKDDIDGNWHTRNMTDYQVFSNRLVDATYGRTFWAEKPLFGGGLAQKTFDELKIAKPSYADYCSVAAKIPWSQNGWLDLYTETNSTLFARERGYTYTNGVLRTRFQTLIKLVDDCARELENQGTGERPQDIDGQLDWGTTEEEMWKEPKKAAEKIKKKFNELKTKNFVLLKNINDAIDRIYTTWPTADKSVVEAQNARQDMLRDYQVRLIKAMMTMPPTKDPAVVRARLKSDIGDTGKYLSTFQKAEADLKATAEALNAAWRAEVEYGQLYKLSPAIKAGSKSLEDLDPGKGDNPKDERVPPESSAKTGTDDDWGGESWKRGAPGEGWR